MKTLYFIATGMVALAASTILSGAPAKKDSASASASPIATYWMDVGTQSGFGAGMSGNGQPDMSQMMAMMSGNAPSYSHNLRLRLASRTPAPAAAAADHLIPPGLRLGASLPLVTPAREKVDVQQGKAKGRILVYWGCAKRVGAGQPLTIDFADLQSDKVPVSLKRWVSAMGRNRSSYSGPTDAPGFGEWPNHRDSRSIPAGASLIGAHKIEGNYSPTIDFMLAQGQDFMGPMTMTEAGASPSGGAIVRWNSVGKATGYALALFSANDAGDTIIWSSSTKPGMANLDYLSPGDVAKAIAAGDALAPSVTQCVIPAEVARLIPVGAVMGIAYGPEVHFSEAPKNPKWAVTVRYKSNGSLMRGMGDMMGDGGDGSE